MPDDIKEIHRKLDEIQAEGIVKTAVLEERVDTIIANQEKTNEHLEKLNGRVMENRRDIAKFLQYGGRVEELEDRVNHLAFLAKIAGTIVGMIQAAVVAAFAYLGGK